jgi:hypothetical protein
MGLFYPHIPLKCNTAKICCISPILKTFSGNSPLWMLPLQSMLSFSFLFFGLILAHSETVSLATTCSKSSRMIPIGSGWKAPLVSSHSTLCKLCYSTHNILLYLYVSPIDWKLLERFLSPYFKHLVQSQGNYTCSILIQWTSEEISFLVHNLKFLFYSPICYVFSKC